jgi:hypothetical protein
MNNYVPGTFKDRAKEIIAYFKFLIRHSSKGLMKPTELSRKSVSQTRFISSSCRIQALVLRALFADGEELENSKHSVSSKYG